MRHRDSRGGGDGRDRRDARDDLERDPRLGQRERLLAASPEDVGVAALQADDLEPLSAERDEEVVDLLLQEPVPRDPQRIGGGLVDQLGRDEAVVHDGVARAEQLEAPHGDQPGVAGTRTDERDRHPRRSSTSSRKKSRRAS